MSEVDKAGEQIEALLARLRASGGTAAETAEELTGLLVGLYGEGLARMVAVLDSEGPAGREILGKLADDPLVGSLLVLHDLHPLDVDARIQRALDQVRPYLGSHAGGVEYLGVADGVARLRLEGSCHGCPSSTVTVRLAIEGAVTAAAPEVSEVLVEGMTTPPEPALLQIGTRPGAAAAARAATGDPATGDPATGDPATGDPAAAPVAPEAGAAAGGAGWVSLPGLGPPSSQPVTAQAAGLDVLVCAVRGTLYAYRDACPACGSSLARGRLDRELLTCQCGARYDASRAGRGLDHAGHHLDPLPLLSDSQGVRVAVPVAVRA